MAKKKRDTSMHRPKRSDAQKESDRVFIAAGLVTCTPFRQIMAQLNEKNRNEGRDYTLGLTQVYYDSRQVLADWREERQQFIDNKIELELAKLDRMEAECWEAWERSKDGRRKTVIAGGSMSGERISGGDIKERSIESTFGDTRYLDIVHKCLERRAALLGLDAPSRSITGVVATVYTKEEIEAEIENKWSILT